MSVSAPQTQKPGSYMGKLRHPKPSAHLGAEMSPGAFIRGAGAPEPPPLSPGSESGSGSSGFTGCDDRRSSSLPDSAVIRGGYDPQETWPLLRLCKRRCPCQNKPLAGSYTFYSAAHFTEYSALYRIQGNAAADGHMLYSP